MELLGEYSPHVVSTIFVGLDIEHSDIDIVCEYQNPKTFMSTFEAAFKGRDSYRLSQDAGCVVGHFNAEGFLFEVYGATTPVKMQPAFRHYQVMQRIALLGGTHIQKKIRALKKTGLKTEPAISQILGLDGNPYEAVLELESWPDEKLKAHIRNCI